MGRPTVTDRSLKPLGRHALLTVLLFLGACTPEPSKTPVDLLLTNGVIIQGAQGPRGGT